MAYYTDEYKLMQACYIGKLETIKELINNGLDPTIQNNYLIRIASQNGHLSVVKYLISIGCDPIAYNNWAIRKAGENGHLSIVKLLYSYGADPTVNNNQTIQWASNFGHIETVKFLALIGCDTDKINITMRDNIKQWLYFRKIFNKCLSEIYGHPHLERTRTENEKFFQESFITYEQNY